MNKKGFTLIELLAVVVILSIIVMITTPNIMNIADNSKNKLFITDVREFASKAIYFYSQEQYKNDDRYFEKINDNTYKVYLKNIDSIKEKKDAYGNKYNFSNSYVTFIEPTSQDGLNDSVVKIYIESCDNNENCHYICNVNIDDLDTNSIKKSCD